MWGSFELLSNKPFLNLSGENRVQVWGFYLVTILVCHESLLLFSRTGFRCSRHSLRTQKSVFLKSWLRRMPWSWRYAKMLKQPPYVFKYIFKGDNLRYLNFSSFCVCCVSFWRCRIWRCFPSIPLHVDRKSSASVSQVTLLPSLCVEC